ncbi:hypothetical protein SAMN05216266_12759 [Amycolatopsis marina]|uniref:Uncharacterized protein n=1 Tax=Amycolatopsis marina TaxID=490629 RepID=A0A1I1CKR1_9PSEU|nr:hypothetical protein [Amycolatopsis marina]SFB61220.1 hypothetical protein SAMN05216266_12759 [Amycolatopsis marina]
MQDPTFPCGHPRVPSNTTRRAPYDVCRTCANERQRAYDRARRERQREEQAELQRRRELDGEATPERQREIDTARALADHFDANTTAVFEVDSSGAVHDRITGEMFGKMTASRDEEFGEWFRELLKRWRGEQR